MMWRSVARASYARHAARNVRITQNSKVLSYRILTLNQHFSTPVFPRTSPFGNPKFFSQYATNANSEPTNDGITYNSGGFDQDPNPFTLESEQSSVAFDEDSSSPSLESDSFHEKSDIHIDLDSFESNNADEACEIDLEKLEAVSSLLQGIVDGSLESSLDSLDLTLHEDFVVRVLETPHIPGEKLLSFFKWVWSKPEFPVTTRVVDTLVQVISGGLRKKEAYALWDLVNDIGEKENSVLNVEILNKLIALFSKLGKGKAGFEVFNKFGEFWCTPNEDTYYLMIEALYRRSFFDWAVSVSEKMLNAGSLPDNEKIGKIISWFCKGSKAKDAYLVYLLAKEKNKHPPQSSVNHLISSLCREDETVQLAIEMLEDLSGEMRKCAISSFSAVIRGLCRIKDVEGAKKLLSKMIDAGPPPGNAVFNSVINSLSKAGDMEEAKEVMKLMESRGLKPDVYTYSVIMSGYAKGGQMDDASEIFSEAKKKHSKLSPVTYHTLIRGYCKLEEFDKALKLLSEMKDFGVQPNTDEYNKLIQSLCLKALDWETAENLLVEMEENGLYLNGISRGLIRAVKELEEEGVETGEVTSEI